MSKKEKKHARPKDSAENRRELAKVDVALNKDQEVIYTRTAKIWIGNDNIIRKVFHERAEETLKDALESMEAMKQMAKGRRLPMLIDLSNAHTISPEARTYYTGNDAFSVASAAAAVTKSLISRVIGNFFMGFNKPEYPRKVFNSESEAVNWLKNFL